MSELVNILFMMMISGGFRGNIFFTNSLLFNLKRMEKSYNKKVWTE